MIENQLAQLGELMAGLRVARQLKQSELAYEAGISLRTLQRLEAGQVVKSDGLLKVIAYLGRLEEVLAALNTPQLSPYDLAREGGVVKKRRRSRVRRSAHEQASAAAEITWPEDRT